MVLRRNHEQVVTLTVLPRVIEGQVTRLQRSGILGLPKMALSVEILLVFTFVLAVQKC